MRLEDNGNHQIEERDYNETFSPVVKFLYRIDSIDYNFKRMEISLDRYWKCISAWKELLWKLMGHMHEDYSNHVCLLKKEIYGHKQSSCKWYRRLKDFLMTFGFVESRSIPFYLPWWVYNLHTFLCRWYSCYRFWSEAILRNMEIESKLFPRDSSWWIFWWFFSWSIELFSQFIKK